MRSYSTDLRERVLKACDAGGGTKAVAERFEVSESWVRRLKRRRQEGKPTTPASPRNNRVPKLHAHADRLRQRIAETPDLTLAEIRATLGAGAALATLWAAVARLGLTMKNSPPGGRAGPPGLEAEAGRGGGRPADPRTFVAALRADGLTAPMVVDGAMTGDLFVACVERVLVPALRPGDVVVDNLACHKQAGVARVIEGAGCTVRYLPPYSPGLNPVELAFSKLEGPLRSAGKRTLDGLWEFLGKSLDAFGPDECRAYFRHDGYGVAPPPQGT
jgi:transposase